MLESGLDQHPVLAAVELVLPQVPDVGDVLDVEDLEAVVQQDAPDQVGEQVRARLPTCADRYTVGPHVYIRTRPGSSGSTGSTDRVRVFRTRSVMPTS